MPQTATIARICRTTDIAREPEGLRQLLEAELIGEASGDDWPEERHLLGECVLMQEERAVGFGRVIWDAHTEDAPRVIDMAFAPDYRSDFFIDSLEQELISEYAAEAEGGDMLRAFDGSLIDVTRPERQDTARAAGYGSRRART